MEWTGRGALCAIATARSLGDLAGSITSELEMEFVLPEISGNCAAGSLPA